MIFTSNTIDEILELEVYNKVEKKIILYQSIASLVCKILIP